MNKVATVLLFINFITVLFPQPGYIHPDEFFQSSEIVAGDVLGVSHERVWEFDPTFPVRNLVFPYLLTGPSLHLLRWMNSTNFVGLKISAVKVVMATRLPMAFISLVGFSATGRLSSHFRSDEYLSQIIWCSSYVTWTYFTRTFSNSVEAFLLALILLIVVNNISINSVPNFSHRGLKDRSKRSNSDQSDDDEIEESNGDSDQSGKSDKKKKVEKRKTDSKHNEPKRGFEAKCNDATECKSLGRTAFVLGFLVIAGFFNRPTFLLFAFVPILYWFVRMLAKSFFGTVLTVIFWGSIGTFAAFFLFIAADTLYYKPNFLVVISSCMEKIVASQYSMASFVESFELIISSLVVTPWNFLKYNSNSVNLAKHGLHPYYTHLLINLPLLLGPLFFPFLAACMLSIFQLVGGRNSESRDSVWLAMMALVPTIGLSLFPHQEPRFLVPLLPIFVVLGVKLVSLMVTGKKLFAVLWIIFNVILNLVYGYLHQAAMIPALSIYQQKLSSPNTVAKMMRTAPNHAFFYKTYPPPRHLFLLDPAQRHFQVHDLAGAPVKDIVLKIRDVAKKRWVSKGKNLVYIFMPSTASQRVTDLLASDLEEYGLKMSTTSICPHLSMESLPRFKQFWAKKLSFADFVMDFCLDTVSIV